MKLTVAVKLMPDHEQVSFLRDTLKRANAACNHISDVAWESQTFGTYKLQKATYYTVKESFDLTAQMVVRCVSKVADGYKLDKRRKRTFRPLGSIAYDDRILRWFPDAVSIWTVNGRQRIPFVCGERTRALLANRQGESDLLLRDGIYYLYATVNVDEPPPGEPSEFIGVDMGIVAIATDSDGNTYSGATVNGLRARHARLRAKLQRKGTKSAKRLLVKRRRKEVRFAKDVNHTISKRIVRLAEGTGRGIAVEDLTGIRDRITARKPQRRTLHSWSFFDLRAKIEYKARLAGVPIVAVDPRNTSRQCSSCGHVAKENRRSQSEFLCVSCGFAANADANAAINIGRGAAVMPPHAGETTSVGSHSQAPAL
jgi:putative transposase